MNRKAKRNKYKKELRKLEQKVKFYEDSARFDHIFQKDLKIQRISCMKPIEEYSRIPADVIKEVYTKEVARHIAEEILKHQEYFKITDTGFGYRYDLDIVKVG